MIVLSGVQKYILEAADGGLCFEAIAIQIRHKYGRRTTALRVRDAYRALKHGLDDSQVAVIEDAVKALSLRKEPEAVDPKPFKPSKPSKETAGDAEYIRSRLDENRNGFCNHIVGKLAGQPVYCQHEAEFGGYCERHALKVAAE